MKYPNNPEVIATLETVDSDGEISYIGDKVVGIQVRQSGRERDGMVDIDVRDFGKKHLNLVIRISYPELMAALACAALNAERDL